MHRLLTDFKVYSNLDLTVTDTDELIDTVLTASEEYIKTMYGIYLKSDTITEIIDGDGKTYFTVKYDIVSIISLTIDGVAIGISDISVKDNVVRLKTITPTNDYDNIEITYTVGWEDIVLPMQLKLALFKLADKLYTDITEDREGVSGYNTNTKVGIDYIYHELPDNFETMINPYKKIRL